jgi:hypothetical protein
LRWQREGLVLAVLSHECRCPLAEVLVGQEVTQPDSSNKQVVEVAYIGPPDHEHLLERADLCRNSLTLSAPESTSVLMVLS